MGIRLQQCREQVAALTAQVTALTEENTHLTTENASLSADITGLNQELTNLADALNTATVNLAASRDTVKTLEAEIDRLTGVVAALRQELEDCQNPTEPPPPPTSTLFGVTVNGGVRKNMPDLHDNVAVSRVFGQGISNWANEPQHKAFPGGKWAVSNSYALSEAALPGYLRTIPAADKAKIVGYADGHELEHPDKNLNPADVKARMRRTAQVIRDAGLPVASCVMGFSIKDDEWLRWIDPDVVDIIAFDKYNSQAKANPPAYGDPADVVGAAKAQSVRFGKPFAFWETGTNNFGEQAKRVAWAKALKAELIKQKANCAIWFDRPSTSGSGWDATLDRPTAEAWLL